MSWIKLTDHLGNKICVNTDRIEEIKEKIYNNGKRKHNYSFVMTHKKQ